MRDTSSPSDVPLSDHGLRDERMRHELLRKADGAGDAGAVAPVEVVVTDELFDSLISEASTSTPQEPGYEPGFGAGFAPDDDGD